VRVHYPCFATGIATVSCVHVNAQFSGSEKRIRNLITLDAGACDGTA